MIRKTTRKETRAAIYVRVSTDEQTTANQERELRRIAEGQGWVVVEVYRDAGISGAKGRDERPAFNALCKDATRRRPDMIRMALRHGWKIEGRKRD
jgi:DNA invertase Pin-like site-specific DNA recombinase